MMLYRHDKYLQSNKTFTNVIALYLKHLIKD